VLLCRIVGNPKGDLAMRQLRGNERMGRRVAGTLDGNLTVKEAIAIRADEARPAAYGADRAEQASVVPLTPRPAAGVPSAGEAA
jgi:hypothetical protein